MMRSPAHQFIEEIFPRRFEFFFDRKPTIKPTIYESIAQIKPGDPLFCLDK